jgi:Fe2+ or Zn2+ uptake regulation protein
MASDNTSPDPREEIVEYLRAHPSAADTVDGIIQWWLIRQRYETARDVIQRALDDLVEQGIIDYINTGNDKKIFLSAAHPNLRRIDQQ